MSDTITIRGFVATEIKSSTTPGGVATASFRIGSTTRRYDKESGTWTDGHTNWFLVQGYRHLAGSMGCSIRKGQPVIVVGKLKIRSWERDGRVYYSHTIDADAVGHDLTWGTANFIRSSTKPLLSLVEQDSPVDGIHQPGGDASFDEPEENDEDANDGGDPEAYIEDRNGDLVALDLETGELAESRA
ncbi:single-stranded DNA-binding protein [Pseudarthrobacter phenanthrenivorans]|uniref:Single-stranded DNA-binding protein n=2 Tax=Pseudarthrobacter phenanthrenivorans TaxID=361575 RepID=A0A3B0FGN1_PSEPS|nr:single-stranded DNA-binding protein [Pseudarthrobacter phenanthrenivorans]ADX73435.1 single stranded DNA-binding protein [Pseudarthrobacter phenanthrenivorans Sphe3]RKO24084.1 single-stranded DNA-binding protein [Pseudarthrobacter phenanthrenivorans]